MSKSIGMIETYGLAISIAVTDAMLKAGNVSIVHHEKTDIALITIAIEGDLTSVKIAIEKGREVAKKAEVLLAYNIISNPDRYIKSMLTEKRKLSNRELSVIDWYQGLN